MAFDINALVASLGAYHRTYEELLYSKLLAKEYSQKYFRTIPGVKDEYIADEFLLTEILQPYQKAWTPKGNASFSPETLKARRIKIDMEFEPVDLERTWEGKRIDGSLPEGQELLEAYIFDQILNKVKKEIEFLVAFKGVFAAPAVGVAGVAGTSADGLLEITDKAITANKIVPVPTGAIDAANARESFELVFDGVDPDFQDQPLICLSSPNLIRFYKRDYRAEFGPNMDYKGMNGEDKSVFIDGTNCEILPIPGMNGSPRIIITTPENLLRVIDGTEEDSNFNLRFQVNRRVIEVLGDFKMGWGYGIAKGLVWANDPNTAPAGLSTTLSKSVNKKQTVKIENEETDKPESEAQPNNPVQ